MTSSQIELASWSSAYGRLLMSLLGNIRNADNEPRPHTSNWKGVRGTTWNISFRNGT